MIIIADKPGQLCNQIIVHANLYLFCKNHRLRLYNPSFHRYKHYFVSMSETSGSALPYFLINLIARILRRLNVSFDFISVSSIGYENKVELDVVNHSSPLFSKFCFVMGWKYRGNKLLSTHKADILDLFSPMPEYQLQVKSFFLEKVPSSDVKIGLHIRRGDYERFEGGRYFYGLEIYAKLIRQVEALFIGKRVIFIVCSNDREFVKELADQFNNLILGPGLEITDLYSLSKCDYLLGPPSTYTMWASFYGNVPLYMVHDPDRFFGLNDFKITSEF